MSKRRHPLQRHAGSAAASPCVFPYCLLDDRDAADDGHRLSLALCRVDNADEGKHAENQHKERKDAGHHQSQHRTERILPSTVDNTLNTTMKMNSTRLWLA